jgi:hypothetical protein
MNKVIIIALIVILMVAFAGYTLYVSGKTLWDWLELLIIPAALVAGAWLLQWAERKTEREIADRRAQDSVLQAYLDRMTELLLGEELHTPEKGDKVRAVARARTLTALRQLDGIRKGTLLRFLSEADLIKKDNPIINLEDVDLHEASLRRANLNRANLSGAWLNEADLSEATLFEADLSKIGLARAILVNANLMGAILDEAILDGAKLTGAQWSVDTVWPSGFTPPPDTIKTDTFDLFKR